MPPPNAVTIPRERQIKIVLLGPARSGKTGLIGRLRPFSYSAPYEPTVGTGFTSTILKDGDFLKAQLLIWDLAGAERFRQIFSSFIPGAAACIITCDLSSNNEIEPELSEWMQLARRKQENPTIIIVGTKSSLDTAGKAEKLQSFAKHQNLPCFITDAKNNIGVDKLLNETADLCLTQRGVKPSIAPHVENSAANSSSSSSSSISIAAPIASTNTRISSDTRQFKVILIGPSKSGKTALINRYINGKESTFISEYQETKGASFHEKSSVVNQKNTTLIFWDIGGAERFQDSAPIHYTGASVVLMTFDLSSTDPINLQDWINKSKANAIENQKIVIVGTKASGNTKTKEEELKRLANDEKLSCFITNAEQYTGVDELFAETTRLCLSKPGTAPIASSSSSTISSVNIDEKDIAEKRSTIIAKLQTYITRIESNLLPLNTTTNSSLGHGSINDRSSTSISSDQSSAKREISIGSINFAAGFWIMKDSRAANRKANYLLAKHLLNRLNAVDYNINVIFDNIPTQRNTLISSNNILGHKDRGINSDELNAAIAQAYTSFKKI